MMVIRYAVWYGGSLLASLVGLALLQPNCFDVNIIPFVPARLLYIMRVQGGLRGGWTEYLSPIFHLWLCKLGGSCSPRMKRWVSAIYLLFVRPSAQRKNICWTVRISEHVCVSSELANANFCHGSAVRLRLYLQRGGRYADGVL